MRFATYNVEWFNSLFDDAGRLLNDSAWSARYNVTRAAQSAALGAVFTALNADAVMIIEAPDTNRHRSTVAALESFAATYNLRARKAIIGFASETQQEIACLYDPDALILRHDPKGMFSGKKGSRNAPRFDGTFRHDLDQDGASELITWSKPPLELQATTASGMVLRLIGVHAKSKAPHGAKDPADAIRISIDNRRKSLAECVWLRQRIDQHLTRRDPLIVMGDFNDGPGLDDYEKLFGHSSIEIVLGEGEASKLHDPHARQALSRRIAALPATARFRIPPEGNYLNALLDYIMVSPDLTAKTPRWTIWHPFDTPACKDLQDALLTASDHFPVTLDITL